MGILTKLQGAKSMPRVEKRVSGQNKNKKTASDQLAVPCELGNGF
jgi:hypothetical protein